MVVVLEGVDDAQKVCGYQQNVSFLRRRRTRTKETHEIKKKKRRKNWSEFFFISSLIGRFGADEVGLQASSAGDAKPVLRPYKALIRLRL